MKNINKSIKGIAVLMCMAALTGCIKETFPMGSTATEEQVQQSPAATQALADGMPAAMVSVHWEDDGHCYFGYPAEMICLLVTTITLVR